MNAATQPTTRPTASEICGLFPLSDRAAPLLRPELSVPVFADLLLRHECFPDAVRFIAYALPRLEVIRWALACARHVLPAGVAPGPGLAAAERWLAAPSDDNRRAALEAARGEDVRSPGACAALAVFLASGSLAPRGLPEVAPPPLAAHQAAVGAVFLAAAAPPPNLAPQRYANFVALGRQLYDQVSAARGAGAS